MGDYSINKSLTIDVSDEEMAQRRKAWTPHPPMVNSYYLDRYARPLGPAPGGRLRACNFVKNRQIFSDNLG